MTDFSKNYNFSESEKKWQEFWQEQQTYKWDENVSREDTFVVDTPPPTVSGQLHIGHVYSYTQTDFIVRFWRMMGKNIFYPIGFDDNGLPTERLVEKQRQIKASSMKREEFIKICQEVVAGEEEKFRTLFNNIALSVDWNLEYRTISPLSCKLSQMSFLDLMQKGEIYRDNQPMLWDPVDQTALAQADIEDKEKLGFMNDIIFRTTDGEELIIATTRPEMLPACVAVFYHPEDDRYKKLKDKFAISPLFNVKIPILPDEMVLQEKGTGLVMCCTFGDQTDILWWKKYKLPTKIIINKAGRIDLSHQNLTEINRELLAQLADLKIVEARNKIIEILKEQNLLVKQVEINQTIKCAERSGAPLEILTTPQWFIHTIKHKDTLLQRIEELNWHPKTMKIRLENWIKAVAFDWCISRQRFFGVPFPVWYSKKSGEEGKVLLADINQLPVNPLTDLPYGYSRDEVEPDRDVMDTWATSAISPQLSSHAISKEYEVNIERHRKLFPMDLRPQAHEILRTWAFDTILKAHLHENSLPWKNIMISGWCLAEDRTKMSKSKGNVISPETLLQQYGADVIRYWASTFKLGADTAYSEDIMKNGKRLINKLWNAAKFVSQHFNILLEKDKNSSLETLHEKISCTMDQWLINELINLINAAKEEMINYEYSSAIALIEKFFWSIFCDNYLEITKIRAYNEDKSDPQGQYSTVLTLYHSLQTILKLFAPFLPFITEEIYHMLYGQLSIHAKGSWPKVSIFNSSLNIHEVENFLEILELVRKSKTEKNLSIKAPIKIIEIKDLHLTDDLVHDLKNVTAAEEIQFVKDFFEEGALMSNSHIKINIFYS